MPAPGDQHRAAATATNPFEEIKPRISEYTAQEIATLASRLEKQLGPEYISSRPGASGQKVHYLAAEKCINLANEVFGFNGWSSSIQSTQIDFVDESQSSGKVSLGLSVIMRVTLRDGTYHEDVGYGHIENCKGKAAAFEKAKKEGTTDALKRALRSFGNILGNCVYDKEYLAKVTKIKIAPSKWDADNLHRHHDFAPIKKESIDEAEGIRANGLASHSSSLENVDEFGGDEFDEADFSVNNSEHPDEVTLDNAMTSEHSKRRGSLPKNCQPPTAAKAVVSNQQARPPAARVQSIAPVQGPQTPTHARNANGFPPQGRIAAQQSNSTAMQKPPQLPPQHQHQHQHQQFPAGNPHANSLQRPQIPPPQAQQNPASLQSTRPGPQTAPQSPIHQRHQPQQNAQKSTPPSDVLPPAAAANEPPVGFVTARAAESVQTTNTLPPSAVLFNPHSESPSIRKTAGFDHTKTKPIIREAVAVGVQNQTPNLAPGFAAAPRSNFVNPQADQTRRIGMPGGAASPLPNRNSYKPPMMKRPAENMQQQRPPLGDVSAGSINVPIDSGGDAKRQRVGVGVGNGNEQINEGTRGIVTG